MAFEAALATLAPSSRPAATQPEPDPALPEPVILALCTCLIEPSMSLRSAEAVCRRLLLPSLLSLTRHASRDLMEVAKHAANLCPRPMLGACLLPLARNANIGPAQTEVLRRVAELLPAPLLLQLLQGLVAVRACAQDLSLSIFMNLN